MLLLCSDVIIQTNTNKFFIVWYLSNFTTTCVGGQIKAFGFLFLPLVMQKVQMVESDCETKSKKRIDLFCVFNSGKVQKGKEH